MPHVIHPAILYKRGNMRCIYISFLSQLPLKFLKAFFNDFLRDIRILYFIEPGLSLRKMIHCLFSGDLIGA